MPDFSLIDIALRWVALFLLFLFLTYLFRDRVTLEGFWGYVILIFVAMPANVLGAPFLHSWHFSPQHPAFYLGLIVIVNVLLLFFWNKMLHGLTCSGWLALLLFCLIFSAFSFLVHLIPPINYGALIMANL